MPAFGGHGDEPTRIYAYPDDIAFLIHTGSANYDNANTGEETDDRYPIPYDCLLGNERTTRRDHVSRPCPSKAGPGVDLSSTVLPLRLGSVSGALFAAWVTL